jgi:primase-polymerase (primpol)-like protein
MNGIQGITNVSIIPPAELAALPQWLIWRFQIRDGQPTKVPHTTMGYQASVTNPEHWSTFRNVCAAYARREFADGIGFVFTASDPYCGIDLDNCYPSDASEYVPWAAGILERFRDTYSELSPSGRGVKIWCRATAPRCGKWPLNGGAIEIYDRARYFAVTGNAGPSIPRVIADHNDDIGLLVRHLDGARAMKVGRIDSVMHKGYRHPALISIAGTLWRRGLVPEAVEAALLVVNAKQCDPPYPEKHVRQIVADMTAKWSRT